MLIQLIPFCVALLLNFIQTGSTLGCINQICQSNAANSILNSNCSVNRQHCGSYGGKRFDNRLFYGVDIACQSGSAIFAPFPGNVSFFRPRGGQNGSECIDTGLKITGHGSWSGYSAMISYIKPILFSGGVKATDLLGYALNFSCSKSPGSTLEPHLVLQLFFQGQHIDPTYRIAECMCTGQICISNALNSFIDKPFKHKPRYGKGYELHCDDIKMQAEADEKVPDIQSPIEAKTLGRFRPWNLTVNGAYTCENDGVFLVGAGKWTDFVVNIYNVKFVVEPGNHDIQQGTVVARRLNCSAGQVEQKSVFLEFRYKGRLVNVTNLITAKDCKLPQL